MAELSRYNVSQRQAGLEGGILKNKLRIKDQKTLEDTETVLLTDAYAHFFDLLSKKKIVFDLPFIFQIHRYFLVPLYSWAGKVRSVDISKDGIFFCPAINIRNSLKDFKKILKENLPKHVDAKKEIARKLALIHNEFNVIHPFREGNGRTLRLFIDLLAVSLGYQLIDYGDKKVYFEACRKGMSMDHKKMTQIFYNALTLS